MSALLARAHTISPAAVWFPALALIVAGPLLAFSGYLMLLDYPAGPEFPKFSWFPLPSSGDIGNSTPLLAIERFLRWVHVYLPDKVLLVAPILLGGIGIYRFTRRHLEVGPWAALFGGTLYVINPFVLDRYLAGHVHFLLAYGLLPWALAPVVRAVDEPALGRAVPLALWLFALGIVDLHIMGIYGLLVLVAIAFAKAGPLRRIGLAAGTVGLALLLSAFWVLPAIFTTPGQGIGAADLEVYATRPRGYSVLPTLLSMYGFWRDEFVGPAQRIPALYLLLVPILGVVTLGLATLVAPGRLRRFAGALGVSALLALVLAAGISFPPTAGTFRWLFDHVPLMGVYREPQKLLALLVLAFGVFGSVGLATVVHGLHLRVRWWALSTAVIGLVVVVSYSYSMLGGLWGQVHLSQYPREWYMAEYVMNERGPGRVLVLPWHLYAVWSFSDGRIVANPGLAFFSREVFASNEAGFDSVPTQSADPFTTYMQTILNSRPRTRWFGDLLAPLRIRYVVWLKEVDFWEYQFLTRQGSLEPVYEGRQLVVFESRQWEPEAVSLEEGRKIGGVAEIVGSDLERHVAEHLYEAPPLVPPSAAEFLPSLVRAFPTWKKISPSEAGYVTTGDRCTDGWRVGNAEARCHVGAAAAFSSSSQRRPRWRPAASLQAVGLLLTVSVLLSLVYWRRFSGRRPITVADRATT